MFHEVHPDLPMPSMTSSISVCVATNTTIIVRANTRIHHNILFLKIANERSSVCLYMQDANSQLQYACNYVLLSQNFQRVILVVESFLELVYIHGHGVAISPLYDSAWKGWCGHANIVVTPEVCWHRDSSRIPSLYNSVPQMQPKKIHDLSLLKANSPHGHNRLWKQNHMFASPKLFLNMINYCTMH